MTPAEKIFRQKFPTLPGVAFPSTPPLTDAGIWSVEKNAPWTKQEVAKSIGKRAALQQITAALEAKIAAVKLREGWERNTRLAVRLETLEECAGIVRAQGEGGVSATHTQLS